MNFVLAGLGPAIHAFERPGTKAWMRGSSPRKTTWVDYCESSMGILARKTPRTALPRGGRDESRCRLEKSTDQIEKGVEPVVVDPVAGVLQRNDLGVAEMAGAPVLDRVGRPALLAVDEEGRAIDALP